MCFKKRKLPELQVDPAVDFESLREEFDDDTEFIKELLNTFVENIADFSKDLKRYGKSNYAEVSAIAHALKGTSANLRCGPLSAASSDLELYIKDTKDITSKSEVDRKINVVLYQSNRVVDEITREYG